MQCFEEEVADLTCLLGHVDHQVVERKVLCRSDAHSAWTDIVSGSESHLISLEHRKVTWCSSLYTSSSHLFSEAFQSFIPLLPFLLRPWGCATVFYIFLSRVEWESVGSSGLQRYFHGCGTWRRCKRLESVSSCKLSSVASRTWGQRLIWFWLGSGFRSAPNAEGGGCRMSGGCCLLLKVGEVSATASWRADLKCIWWMS